MLGAIIGDVAGSYLEVLEVAELKNSNKKRCYDERVKILDRDVRLFDENCSCTDDSILTMAIYDAIVNGDCDYEKYLREYGLKEYEEGIDKYGRSRFGGGFVKWLNGEGKGDSFGNGSAMRIGPVGYLFDSLEDVIENARLATIPSHNHPDSIKGAEAVAVVIFLLRNGYSKEDVKTFIENKYYKLNYDLNDLQRNNVFSSKCSVCVPQALFVFFESDSFEDSIRKALSIGGDTDTIACIVGSVSEAYYGVPDKLKDDVRPYLKPYMYNLLENRYFKRGEMK